jgi:hypothetical protein
MPKMKSYNVVFTAKALVKAPVGTISRQATEGNDGLYRGVICAENPDDAFFRVSESYRDANVRHCWRADE